MSAFKHPKFTPIRGAQENIDKVQVTDGYFLMTTDTGKMYLDANGERIPLGGSGASILYGNAPSTLEVDSDGYYQLTYNYLEDSNAKPKAKDLILNQDGTFYRVVKIEDDIIYCRVIAVSGTGGSGGGVSSLAKSINLTISPLETTNLINGQSQAVYFTATSATDNDGTAIDDTLTITWTLAYTEDNINYTTYATGNFSVNSGELSSFDFGSRARESASSRLTLTASQLNAEKTISRNITFVTSSLSLTQSANFSNINIFQTSSVIFQCNVTGNMDKFLDIYWDDILLTTLNLSANSSSSQSVSIHSLTTITPGYHTIKAQLFQSINGKRGLSVDPLEFEIATYDGSSTEPIIWLGSYSKQYYNYDNIQIPFRVYDPMSTASTEVHLYKDNIELASSPRTITDNTSFSIFEITDADLDIQNYYTISCGDTRRDIFFTVVQDPDRDMSITQQSWLQLSFDAKGRSNSESTTNRKNLVFDNGVKASFEDFNWYNNGWIIDDNNNTCLRISNGARFSIPIGNTVFASSTNTQQSHTYEFQFKIRNIQKYDSSIHNVTRYKDDSAYYEAFKAQSKFTNYDAFLQDYLGGDGYDELEFDYVDKQINLDIVQGSYYQRVGSNVIGWGLGPQDAFFSNGTNTVSVSYVEDEMVNLSIVYQHNNKRIFIYLNGVLTGVIGSTLNSSFTIGADSIVFDSTYCDIDLYKMRIYNTALSVNDICTNYAVDKKDVDIYDQNGLAEENTAINEYQFKYENMITYNQEHPSEPLMPYIVFDTSDSNNDDRLSWSKSTTVNVAVTFVNTGLDRAYESGELSTLAAAAGQTVEDYYLHHCPSWHGSDITMNVQGTSSQFYPRRNYKIKTKGSDKKIHMYANKGPFAIEEQHLDWFYFDNDKVGTTKFTMKIDYMESSGSYNVGFCNLVNNAYAQHPLKDYETAKAFTASSDGDYSYLRTNVQGFPVLAFHKKSDGSYTYIGRYNMLLDKGSDECYGFKVDKTVTQNYVDDKKVSDIAECWEFSNNSRGFCSFRDPLNRKVLSFNTGTDEAPETDNLINSFEYRYNSEDDILDILYKIDATTKPTADEEATVNESYPDVYVVQNPDSGRKLILDKYKNWEKACQWVWSTCLDDALTEAQIAELDDGAKEEYKLDTSVTYGEKTYKYDSYEYRGDKFLYELKKHFNLDYLATYFVMTEVFECYDSRGKNCMMASWGPQEPGGDYIWYPIFYDLDTQLGINNTGIPSFDYDVDATVDGSFSTNDSVLWNNFYKFFKNEMIAKYRQLRGNTQSSFTTLTNAPLTSVAKIEKWYTTDPTECKSISMRGVRPLIAINLDEYYKYISITNNLGSGYLNSGGTTSYDNGGYFYALQGDRSQSRQQFLTNRLVYIDSWLNQGDYERAAGSNTIWGRVRANNPSLISDKWVTGSNLSGDVAVENLTGNEPYYKDDGTKVHEFDAEYWVNVTPIRNSYVTLGDDNESYASQKYTGTTIKFEIDKIKKSIMESPLMNEQLFYIYGTKQIGSLGDLSKLYWTEFHTEADGALKLTDLNLGYDAKDEEGSTYYSKDTNDFVFLAGSSDYGMPLLKEVNLSNITFKNAPSFDFSSSEKLTSFRATGSNVKDVIFAEGVALDTLYLPETITRLSLTEARFLENIITNYEYPVKQKDGTLLANPGLYIPKLTDMTNVSNGATNIASLSIIGGNLGYDSYKLLHNYYLIRKANNAESKINMTNVNWCPYTQLVEGDTYNPDITYYIDNGHYGFTEFTSSDYNSATWDIQILNGELYKKNTDISDDTINQISDYEMFETFRTSKLFLSTAEQNNSIPNITGIVYINNATPVDEYYIRNTLQAAYPDLVFFFANVNQAYTAKFILQEDDGTYQIVGKQTIEEGWFENPIVAYGDITDLKANYDFYGWSNTATGDTILASLEDKEGTWSEQILDENIHDYIFYAIFKIHQYSMTFIDGDGENSYIKKITYGEALSAPTVAEFVPYKNDLALADEMTYSFAGWSLSEDGAIVDLSNYRSTKDYTFYPIFEEISIYESSINYDYFQFVTTNYDGADGVICKPATGANLKGKVLIPAMSKENKSVLKIAGFYNQTNITHIFFQENNKVKVFSNDGNAGAFYGCTNLIKIEIPSGLERIEDNCFQGDQALQLNSLDNGALTYIGNSAFTAALAPLQGESVINFHIGGTVQTLGDFAINNSSYKYGTFTIGSESSTSQLTNVGNRAIKNNSGKEADSIIVYASSDRISYFNGLTISTATTGDYNFQCKSYVIK